MRRQNDVREILDPNLPVSVVLGAGGIRGLAHVGVLEILLDSGFRITEMIGVSVGALIAGYYAAVGLDLATMRRVGLSLRSRHLLIWAVARRLPRPMQAWSRRAAGPIPHYLDRLSDSSLDRLHHGVERVGIVLYDRARQELVYSHTGAPGVPLADAVRGAVCIPGLFPPRRCAVNGRVSELTDAGALDHLPVAALLRPPFRPMQIVAIDLSSDSARRDDNERIVGALRERHPAIPIVLMQPDTLGEGTVVYRRRDPSRLLAAGRASALVGRSGNHTHSFPHGVAGMNDDPRAFVEVPEDLGLDTVRD